MTKTAPCLGCGKIITRPPVHGPCCSHCEYMHRKAYHASYRKGETRKISVKNQNDTERQKKSKRRYNVSEKGISAMKKYRQTDKGNESVKKQVLTRRARLNGGITNLPKGWKERLKSEYPSCAYCGSDKKLEIEHLLPIAGRGASGNNEYSNLVMACRVCNRSKWNMFLEEWFEKYPEKRKYFFSNPRNIDRLNYLAKVYADKGVDAFDRFEKITL